MVAMILFDTTSVPIERVTMFETFNTLALTSPVIVLMFATVKIPTLDVMVGMFAVSNVAVLAVRTLPIKLPTIIF
ncbi:hypothetical protein PBCV1_a023R [Paramecium bursaria Chlorella virus 1]|uniref:Uncharacterized protein n=1 Tax=Paramecium bursaria Chlorella virus 1 TaxID=10506 RepID=Q89358_PBCV1|nr:hypothetical protein PBCV1_a023R [Paramecium bursaria Chlorella virus 1]AAC96391.1 hypothetical protein [Paramecium bursaria Chlorella virus 1]